MNSTWVRSPAIEDSYEVLHSFRPDIYFSIPQQRGVNKVKLVYGGKEVVLTEILESGLTKESSIEINGEKQLFKTVYEAEQETNKILRS